MKLKFAIGLFAAFAAISCSDDDENPRVGKMSATVDGNAVSLTKVMANVGYGVPDFSFHDESNQQMGISIYSGLAEMTYTLPAAAGVGVNRDHIWYEPENGERFHIGGADGSGSGKIVITSIDEQKKVIKGTFEGTMVNESGTKTITLTGGTFDVPYTLENVKGTLDIGKINGTATKGALRATNYSFFEPIEFSFASGAKNIWFKIPFETSGEVAVADLDVEYRPVFVDGIRFYRATSGTISVTSHNPETEVVEGTYNNLVFESYPAPGETVSITEGSFSIDFKK